MFSWNSSWYALIGSVTLPRRFHLGIVFGGRCDVSTKPERNYLLRSILIWCSWWNFRSTFDHVVYNDLFPGSRKIGTERPKLAV